MVSIETRPSKEVHDSPLDEISFEARLIVGNDNLAYLDPEWRYFRVNHFECESPDGHLVGISFVKPGDAVPMINIYRTREGKTVISRSWYLDNELYPYSPWVSVPDEKSLKPMLKEARKVFLPIDYSELNRDISVAMDWVRGYYLSSQNGENKNAEA